MWFAGLALVAFVVAAMVTHLLRPLSHRVGLVDYPDERKRHSVPTPTQQSLGRQAAEATSIDRSSANRLP